VVGLTAEQPIELSVEVGAVLGEGGVLQLGASLAMRWPGAGAFESPLRNRCRRLDGVLGGRAAVARQQLAFVSMARLCGVTVATHTSLGLAEEIGPAPRPRLSAINGGSGGESSNPLAPVFPSDPREVSSEPPPAAANFCGGGSAQPSAEFRAGQHIGNRALADADTEHLVEQAQPAARSRSPGDVEVEISAVKSGQKASQRIPAGGGALSHGDSLAHPAMTMNAVCHRANRRQIDMIISVKAQPDLPGQRVLAWRAVFCNSRTIRSGLAQEPKHAGRPFCFFAARRSAGWLRPAMAGDRGVRGLGWPTQPRLEFGIRRVNSANLRALRRTARSALLFG